MLHLCMRIRYVSDTFHLSAGRRGMRLTQHTADRTLADHTFSAQHASPTIPAEKTHAKSLSYRVYHLA